LSPSRRREAIEQVRRALPVSERRTCKVLGQHRSTQRHPPRDDANEQRLTADIIALAKDYGRYGYQPSPSGSRWRTIQFWPFRKPIGRLSR